MSSESCSFKSDYLNTDEEETVVLFEVATALDDLLHDFDLIEVKVYLIEAGITYKSLKYLSKEDIKVAIPNIGLRAQFREKLLTWRNKKYGINDEPLSPPTVNKVHSWLQNQSSLATKTTFSSVGGSKLSKKLKFILEETAKGKAIVYFYSKKGHLAETLRADLINILLEDIFFHNAILSPKDFPAIVDEILENFPAEIQEYYFLRREKKNPIGKLYDKYVNQKRNRSHLSLQLSDSLVLADPITQNVDYNEIDEPLLMSMKAFLSRDLSNGNDVKDKWERTFLLRQKELKTSESNYEFLKNWPLYSNAKAHELVSMSQFNLSAFHYFCCR